VGVTAAAGSGSIGGVRRAHHAVAALMVVVVVGHPVSAVLARMVLLLGRVVGLPLGVDGGRLAALRRRWSVGVEPVVVGEHGSRVIGSGGRHLPLIVHSMLWLLVMHSGIDLLALGRMRRKLLLRLPRCRDQGHRGRC